MSEDLDYEEMHRRIREKYETPPRKVLDYKEPYVPIEHSIRNSPKFDYLGDPDHWPEEGDTGDYEDDDYYESDEYADKATAELAHPGGLEMAFALAAAEDATPRSDPNYDYSKLPPEQQSKQTGVWTDDYDNLMEQKKVDAGGRGQATTKPGSSQVTAGERETYFAPWETEGMTDEELMQIGAHPSQRKTLPPMDTTREHTVADKERRAQQVAERQAAKEGTGAQSVEEAALEKTVGSSRGTGGTDGGGGTNGTDGGGPEEGPSTESSTIDHNTEFYKKHLPKELHNDLWALEEAAKNAAAIDYNSLMAANNGQAESSSSTGIDSDGDGIDEPFERLVFETGEVFFVSEDGTLILRGHDQEN